MTDAAVLHELGRRLARHRIERNWTQAELAAAAGVGQATVQRAERGDSVQMTSMVKLLRTLELLGGLDLAVPESIELPIARLEREQRKLRRRARASGRARVRRPGRARPADESSQSQESQESQGYQGSREAGESREAGSREAGEARDSGEAGESPEAGETREAGDVGERPWTWGDDPGGGASA